MKHRSFIFNKIDGVDSNLFVRDLLAIPFSEDTGFGFRLINEYENSFEFVLLKRISTNLLKYDKLISSFQRASIEYIKEIRFEFWPKISKIICFGGIEENSRLISTLKKLYKSEILLNPIKKNPYDIYMNLLSSDFSCTIEELAVNNFKIESGIVGLIDVSVYNDSATLKNILSSYKMDIKKLKVKVFYHEFEVNLLFNQTGIHKVSANILIDEDFIDSVLKFVYN